MHVKAPRAPSMLSGELNDWILPQLSSSWAGTEGECAACRVMRSVCICTVHHWQNLIVVYFSTWNLFFICRLYLALWWGYACKVLSLLQMHKKTLDAIQNLKWVFKMSFVWIMITGTCLSEVLHQRIHWTTKEAMPSVGSLTKFNSKSFIYFGEN